MLERMLSTLIGVETGRPQESALSEQKLTQRYGVKIFNTYNFMEGEFVSGDENIVDRR
ncbi:hypothetical protein ABNX05_13800 [Lysinibacillus sp. M3]|uniref:Uncharacterized protein n=1 Tax=Lysinibacillus zambalensis TaxID=3160866 RepID=A0ABV1MWR3_9BACI